MPVEDVVDGAARILAQNGVDLPRLLTPRQPPYALTHSFMRPPMGEIAPEKIRTGAHQHIHLAPLDAGDSQHLGDRQFGKSARAFSPVQPFFRYGRQNRVVVEQRRCRIMRASM